MKKHLLTLVALLMLTVSAGNAQTTVRRYLRVSDNSLDLLLFGDANSRNLADNSISLGDSWCAAGWNFESAPLDLTKYDKLVVKLKDVTSDTYEVGEDGGSAVEFRLFDSGYWDGAASVFCHRVMANQMEFEFELGNNELYKENDEPLNLSHVTIACFWCFSPCTIFIDEIYLEKTLAAGEKEYDVDPFAMTEEGVNYKSDDIFVDETNWTLPIYGAESFAGWQWNTPQDWSAYRYLVIVPQVPFASTSPVGTKPFQFNLSDGTYKFSNAELRHFFYNRQRAMVIDLSNMGQYFDTDAEGETQVALTDFNVKNISALWANVALGDGTEVDLGISAIYLTNTAPTWCGGNWLECSNIGDYVLSNDAPDQYATICLPFNAAVCGAAAYSIKGADKDAGKLVLERKTGILEAGVPYILKTNCAANITFYRAGDSEAGDGSENGALQGVLLRKKFAESDGSKAVLNDEGVWVAVESDAIVPANGAYIDITKLTAVTATDTDETMPITADLSDVQAGIGSIKMDNSDNATTYTLSGMKAGCNTKGIHISKNKKIIK